MCSRVGNLIDPTGQGDEFDKNDWDALRVAIRIVYETEELRVALSRKRLPERTFAVSYWLDSIESGITFMSWTREVADITTGTTYPARFPTGVSNLWLPHSSLARHLLAVKRTPSERLSILVELGGIELAFAGCAPCILEPCWQRLRKV